LADNHCQVPMPLDDTPSFLHWAAWWSKSQRS
jgi:hypothetical protein